MASKDVENSRNMYNHNFKGTYCTCDLPYPDPNADEQVEMIQCCICEDWFHEEHIGLLSSEKVSGKQFPLGFHQQTPPPPTPPTNKEKNGRKKKE